jgi:hypothetical protein
VLAKGAVVARPRWYVEAAWLLKEPPDRTSENAVHTKFAENHLRQGSVNKKLPTYSLGQLI